MKEMYLKKNKTRLFLLFAFFFFARTALLSPMYCFLMNSDYPYFRFSVGGVFYIAFAMVLSLISAKLVFSFWEKLGEIAALIYIVAASDPLFFGTNSDPFELLVDILAGLLILNAINEKKIIPVGAAFPIVLFIFSFLVPFSVLGYAPVMLGIYVLANRKAKKEDRYWIIMLLGIVCAVIGFLLNRILTTQIMPFNEWFESFTFADITETKKRLRLAAALVPAAVFAVIFLCQYKKINNSIIKKKSERKENYDAVLDAFFIPTVITAVSIIFVDAEGFRTLNIIIPAIILTLIYHKDEVCIKTLESIFCYIREHKMVSLIAFVVIFALALYGAEDYYPAKQLISCIVY